MIEVIDESPDWPRIWDVLTNYLKQFRDFELGNDLKLDDAKLPNTDEELLVSIVHQAFALELPEVDRQTRLAAIAIGSLPSGNVVFDSLLGSLLKQVGAGPAEAMCIFHGASENQFVAKRFAASAQELVNHGDVAVSVSATKLASRLGIKVSLVQRPLPGFYSLALPDEERGENYDPPPGVSAGGTNYLITSPLDYTFALEAPVRILSDASGVSQMHIRQRCGHFMQAFGGADEVVKTEPKIRSALENLHMRMTYNRPLMATAVLCLRQVAGEIYHAGLISGEMLSYLLHRIGFAAIGSPPIAPAPRPSYLSRPKLDGVGYGVKEEAWLDNVQVDVAMPILDGDLIFAEVTEFKKQGVGGVTKTQRLRLNTNNPKQFSTFDEAVGSLPRMMGFSKHQPVDTKASPSLVRRLEVTGPPSIPVVLLSLCSQVAKDLKWSLHPQNPFLFTDTEGQVMIKVSWWRDGSPRDVRDDVVAGEGCLVLLTDKGAKQLEAQGFKLSISTWAWRSIDGDSSKAAVKAKKATSF